MLAALILCVAFLTAVLLFPRAVAAAADSGTRGLQQLVAAVIAVAGKSISGTLNLIRRAGNVSPVATFGGFLVVCAAIPIARSEFEVTRRSLLLVWADEIASDRVALSLVLMTFAVGLLMHAFESRAFRGIIGCVAVSLTIMTATLAYYRTIEIEKIRLAGEAITAVLPADDGGLTIGGRSESEKDSRVAPPPPRVPDRLPAFLAGLLAFLLSSGGIIVSFGAFSLGGPAFVALLAFPALVLLSAVYGATRLAEIVIAIIAGAAPDFIDACRSRWVELVRFIKRTLPPTWTVEADDWRHSRAFREAEFARQGTERAASADRSISERVAEKGRLERYRQFIANEQDRDLRSMSEALDASRQQVTKAHLDGVRELLDILAAHRREFFGAAVQDAFRNLRAHAAKVPLQVVSMLFWPLDRVWRMVGENLSPDLSERKQAQGTPAGPTASNSTKEDS